jgi:hypothetical protein
MGANDHPTNVRFGSQAASEQSITWVAAFGCLPAAQNASGENDNSERLLFPKAAARMTLF